MFALLACAGCGKGSTAHWIEQLKAADSRTRIEVVHTLQERKTDAAEVVPALTATLQDDNTYVRRDAARALGSFGAEATSAIPALQAARRDREPSVRKAADIALSRIDPQFGNSSPMRQGRGK
ncbi:MAG TPA: HEAT repeat domain-containing protein [Gemmataceae bacterium]